MNEREKARGGESRYNGSETAPRHRPLILQRPSAMNILVCIKQVPDLEQLPVDLQADGQIAVGAAPELRMNRFDEFAVEAALQLKEALAEIHIDVVSVGSEAVLAVIKRAIGMGVDQGILLDTGDRTDPGPTEVARHIARCAGRKHYDLILTGSWSEDGMNGQVGPMTAALLDRPCATQVMSLKLALDRKQVDVEREVEAGNRERLQLRLPALLALQSGINRPRYPSLSNLLRANRQAVETLVAEDDAADADPVACLGFMQPPRTRAGRLLEGSPQEKAETFLTLLREKAFIR